MEFTLPGKRIGILGKMASGKSTLAKELCRLEPRFKTLSFAGKIKQLASELFGMQNKDRHLLQQIGSKMREIRSSVWIDLVVEESSKYTHVVVDDVRFPDELAALQSAGFTIVYLEVDPEVQKQRLQQTYGDDSDTHLQGFDHESERANQYSSQADIVSHPRNLPELHQLAKTLVNTDRV